MKKFESGNTYHYIHVIFETMKNVSKNYEGEDILSPKCEPGSATLVCIKGESVW